MAEAVRRSRAATRRRLIEAVGRVLARDGYRGLGVNTVAAEAGVDKVLIYRYFGGFDGLLVAFARETDAWPTADELVGGDAVALRALPPVERFARLFGAYVAALQARPATLEILAWETAERTALTAAVEAIRERRSEELLGLVADDIRDRRALLAATAVIAAALTYLVLRARTTRRFGGVDLAGDAGWGEINRMVGRMLAAAFAEPRRA